MGKKTKDGEKLRAIRKHQIYKNKEKKYISCVAGACYTEQGIF